MGVVAGLALGEAAIVAIALLLAAYEGWLFVRRRRAEHLWATVGACAMATYSVAMLLHYDANPEQAAVLSLIEAAVFVVVGHCSPAFAIALTKRRFPVPVWALVVSLVFWLMMVPWLAPSDLVEQPMLLLDHPFPRIRPSPIYGVGVAWALLLAVVSLAWVARRGDQRSDGGWRSFSVGGAIWAAAGAHDAIVPMLGLPFALNLFEYGFCAFALIMVAHDVRHYMSMLSASEQDFRGLIDRSPLAVFISHDGELVYANARAGELIDRDARSLVGRALTEVVHPDDAATLVALSRTDDPRPVDIRLSGPQGSLICEMFGTRTRWNGRPASVLIAHDVSGSRALTARMMEADRLISVGTVAAAAGHEINNPLAYVLMHLEGAQEDLIRERAATGDAPEALERVESALGGARRIADLVRSIGFFSRPHEGHSVFELGEVLESAVAITANQIRHAARLDQQIEEGLFVMGNPTKVGQVLVNLLVNAAQAIEGGGRENVITIRARAEDERIICEVTDTGPGIAPELQARIFEPFFTTKSGGSGIGLDIARETLRNIGGELSVESEPGAGATFVVELPRTGAPAKHVSKSPSLHPRRRARVLIVDDEPELLRALARALRADADVTPASSVQEALDVLEEAEPFDLVLSDLMMPGGSGMELYGKVAERWPQQRDRMVFMTGGAFSPEARAFRDEVENLIIGKPLDLARVRELLYVAVERATEQMPP